MRRDLYNFFVLDDRSHWKAARWIFAVMFLYGIVFHVLLERPLRDVATEANLVGLTLFAAWVFWYCVRVRISAWARDLTDDLNTIRVLSAAVSLVLLAVSSVVPFGSIEASIVDRHLLAIVSGTVGKEQVYEANRIISSAQQNRIKVTPQVLTKVAVRLVTAKIKDPVAEKLTWDIAYPVAAVAPRTFNVNFFLGGAEQKNGIHGVRIANQTVTLDGRFWFGMVFDNCVVVYEGGQTSLMDVYFTAGTRFIIAQTESGRQLVGTLLASIVNAESDPYFQELDRLRQRGFQPFPEFQYKLQQAPPPLKE